MKSNLDNCFYFTVFKDHRPSMAITNWLKHRHFPFLKNKLAVCLQDFVLIALCVVRMLMKDLKESLDTSTHSSIPKRPQVLKMHAKQTKLPYLKYS